MNAVLDDIRFGRALSAIGYFFILIFLLAAPLPVAGYLTGIIALAFVMLFSFRRSFLLLGSSALGALLAASLVYEPSWFLIGFWVMVIFPGIAFGGLLSIGGFPTRAFLIAMILVSAISLLIYAGEREILMKMLDDIERLTAVGSSGGSSIANGSVEKEAAAAMATLFILVRRLMPSLIALSGVAQLFLAAVLVLSLLRRAGRFTPSFTNFVFWKMPERMIYLTGLILLARLLGSEPVRVIADNALFYIGFFYAVFGLAVVEFFLRKLRFSNLFKVLFYIVFALLYLPGLIAAAALGLFDSYFDFRRVRARLIG